MAAMTEHMRHTWTTQSADETKRLAAAFSACLQTGDVVVLNGDLGAGKTQFVQGVAGALGVQAAVTSPTFNILQTYPVQKDGDSSRPTVINHFDLYRLENMEELDDIGYWEALEDNGVSFIEWGDKFPDQLPDDYLEVAIVVSPEATRTLEARAHGTRSEELLACWTHVAGEQA